MNSNPFSFSNNPNPRYFCNRDYEIEFCKLKIENAENFYIISANGIGKTRLINHIFGELSKLNKYYLVYINLLTISSPKQFLASLLSEILKFFRNKSKNKVEQLNEIIFDKDDQNSFSLFEMTELELKSKLLNVIEFLGLQKKSTIIAIDDFQFFNDVLSPLVNDEFWQGILSKKGVQFIFSGTEKVVVQENAALLSLPKIDENIYKRYIINLFEESKIIISKKGLSLLFSWSEGNTSVIHNICSKLWQNQHTKIKASHVKSAINEILLEQDKIIQFIRRLLSQYQWRLLVSIAIEGTAKQVTSAIYMDKYQLNAPSSVKTAITALLEKGLIRKVNQGYQFTDVFMADRIKENHST